LPIVRGRNPELASVEESYEIVDLTGTVIGTAPRSELHRNPALLHRVVHVLLFDQQGRLLLQKRSASKDTAPGAWDTSVGGHVNIGEDIHTAALREMKEELGVRGTDISYLYQYRFTDQRESELVSTFRCTFGGVIRFNTEEIDEVRYWTLRDIKKMLGSGIFSSHFEAEMARYLLHINSR
jgi:isopentenyl-diphosphate delta-isomerase type 1